MAIDLYAGIYVSDYARAAEWYTRFFGQPPSYVASSTEAVWELAENRSVAIEEDAGHAGHSILSVFVDDFDERIARITARGIEPAERVTYGNGVRKAIYRDPDGNSFGYGGPPAD